MLGGRGEELQPRVGPLQLGPLRRQAQRHDPQCDDCGQAGQEEPHRIDRGAG